jgi:hypothetical protein
LPEPATLQQLAGRDAYLDGLLDDRFHETGIDETGSTELEGMTRFNRRIVTISRHDERGRN